MQAALANKADYQRLRQVVSYRDWRRAIPILVDHVRGHQLACDDSLIDVVD